MAEKFFQATAVKSGTYEFATAGKFVDRNINLIVPAAEVIAQGGLSKTFDVVASATVGEKNQVTNTYPVSGVKTEHFDETDAFPVEASITKKGFTDSVTYPGLGSYNITVNASTSGNIPAAAITVGPKEGKTVVPNSIIGTNGTAKVATGEDNAYYINVEASVADFALADYVNATGTAGYYGNAEEISVSSNLKGGRTAAYKIPIVSSSLGNAAKAGVAYTENTSVIIPSEGALYIEEGYLPATKITLDQMLEGNADQAAIGEANILANKIAYDVDGKKLVGTMPDNGGLGEIKVNSLDFTRTIPAGYTSGGTITTEIPALAKYGFDALVSIPDENLVVSSIVNEDGLKKTYNVSAKSLDLSFLPKEDGAVRNKDNFKGTASNVVVGEIAQSSSSVASGSTLAGGSTLSIGAGYYPTERTFTVPSASASVGNTVVTAGLELGTAPDTYTNPELVATKDESKVYVEFRGTAAGETGKVLESINQPAVKYLEVYTGTVTIK